MIQFKENEVSTYPLLEQIKIGLSVIGLQVSDYNGLNGVIKDIKYGQDKETENETILDIYVDFEEPEYSSIEKTHSHLNGTSINQVICGEDELGFLMDEQSGIYLSFEGKAVCPHCFIAMDGVTETQTTDIYWDFKNGKYVKKTGELSSEGKHCVSCNGFIEDFDAKVFIY